MRIYVAIYNVYMLRIRYSRAGLFMGTFVSASLLVFGIGTMASIALPTLVTFLTDFQYQPRLPVAEARGDGDFIDFDSIPAKELFVKSM